MMVMREVPMSRISLLCSVVFLAGTLRAATWHVDPQAGSPQGDGSAVKPWQTLQQVLDSNLIETREGAEYPYSAGMPLKEKNSGAPVKAGDTLLLGSGYHGDVLISRCYNEAYITIMPEPGSTPQLKSLKLQAASRWRIIGLSVSPEFAPEFVRTTLITLESHNYSGPSNDIEVASCTLRTVADVSGWTMQQWDTLSCNGISVTGTGCSIHDNILENVNFGISISGDSCRADNNRIVNFSGDGMRGLGDFDTFTNNTVMNCYDVNENHDDGFQSWSVGDAGSGSGVVKGIVLSGNVIINYTDPDQPFRETLQGIGCFDGIYEDFLIENNVVITDHWHGISLYGAVNCRIVNNTVCDINATTPGPPWIMINRHKDGRPGSGCIVRNNLTTKISISDSLEVTQDHNVIIDNPENFFTDYRNFNLHLSEGCGAIAAGTVDGAPVTDKDGTDRLQDGTVDAGAYEYSANGILQRRVLRNQAGTVSGYRLLVQTRQRNPSGTYPCFLINGRVTAPPSPKNGLRLRALISRN